MIALQEMTAAGTGAEIPPHILVMDDEEIVCKGLEMVLTEEGYEVDLAMSGRSALETFADKDFDLLVADLRLPDIDGMEVIKLVKEKRPATEVVVITGYSSVNSAVDAMRLGVSDYLLKPFSEDQIKESIRQALHKEAQENRTARIRNRVEDEAKKYIQKSEVLKVLNRTCDDSAFWVDLMENGSAALEGYQLTDEAKAAIVSGDLAWINRNVGELTQKQLMFIYKRLEREAW